MVVTARAFANGGLGISGVPATVVNLNYSTGSQAPEKIFVVTNRSKKSSEWTVDAKWISSEHLEIGYNAALQKIEFQAVKWNDVYITYATIQPMPKARGMTKI